MRDIVFYVVIGAALIYFDASPLAWTIFAAGITYAVAVNIVFPHLDRGIS